MAVLVAVASKYGSTREIAEAIGGTLRENGVDADVVQLPVGADEPGLADPGSYDAVVLGSAVYLGKWMVAARRFASDNAAALGSRPVWLFSSGPIGSPQQPVEADAVRLHGIEDALSPVEHRIFAGKLDRGVLGLTQRAVVTVIRAEDGDDRDWDAISTWATGIARSVIARSVKSG
jgi:menaquinone-dependent protoporphyrinogen oxidase